MEKLFTLPFIYNAIEYYLLVQIKNVGGVNNYHAVLVTENLTFKLYGSYVFEEVMGQQY
jgi:hypothetical protein